MLIELGALGISEEGQVIPPELEALLTHYTLVFEEPKELPPHRAHDHAIVL